MTRSARARSRRALPIQVACFTVAAALLSACAPSAASTVTEVSPTRAATTPDTRPNIVLITTDDETMTDMRWMPRTRHLIGDAGVTFPNMLSPHPLCCPARAEILTGQYAQNNGVRSNSLKTLGGFHRLDNANTIATWLRAARYQTAFVGKYLNEYTEDDGLQPGWEIFNPTVKNVYGYFDYTMFNNGDPEHYTRLHNADLVGEKTVDYIHRFAGAGRPFFIWASQVAPHGACVPKQELTCWQPPIPAARHAHLFSHERSPSLQDPAFDEADMTDKPAGLRDNPLLAPDEVNQEFRERIRSLQAVDEAVADTVRALRDTGELDNTIIMFTTDNGYLLGEHRYMFKNVPYEQAVNVPLLVRGPGIPAGQTRDQTVATIDLAPTMLQAADAAATVPVDGRSILPILSDPSTPGYDTVLIQSGPLGPGEVNYGWHYRGVRTSRYTYAHYPSLGFTELYDRLRDPAELTNLAGDPGYAAVQAELERRARLLGACSGTECRPDFGPMPSPATD